MHRPIFIFIVILFIFLTETGYTQKTMYHTIGHQTEGSEGRNTVQAADGGYFMTYYIYYSSNWISSLTKINCAGATEWEKFYEEAYNCLPVDIIPQADNGCLLLLSVRNASAEYQSVVMRIDHTGNTVWTQRVDMHAAATTGCMTQHADGSIYVCGVDSVDATVNNGTKIAKLNASGQLLWIKEFSEIVDNVPRVLTVTSDHKVIVAGQAAILGNFFTNIFIMVLDKDGNFIRRKIFTTPYDDEVYSITADHSGNVALTGNSYFIAGAWDVFFLKLDGQLNILQSKFYDGGTAQGETGRCITPASDNSFAIFGDEGGFNERNPLLIKIDSNGNIQWTEHYPLSPTFTNYIFHGSQCNDGGFVMTGDVRPANQFRMAPFIKTAADGNMGCFSSPYSLSTRIEQFVVIDSILNEFALPVVSNTQPVPYSQFTFPIINTTFCQSLVPCGSFSWTVDSLCPRPCLTFHETSELASSWLWEFEGGTPSVSTAQQPPSVCYSTPGPHQVKLTLTNPIGAVSYTRNVIPPFDCPVTIPNIFTPDGDGFNDVFQAENIYEPFSLKIINRWGLEIFSAGAPGRWWSGFSSGGKEAVEGVYYYLLVLPQSNREFSGTVTLIR